VEENSPVEDKVDGAEKTSEDVVPDVPDVPTNEPAEDGDGQPDAKKRKVSSGEEVKKE
jgi:hypothetical protein